MLVLYLHMKRMVVVLFASLCAVLYAQESVSLPVINRIRAEAYQKSKVMETAFYLTDVHGPRLSGSPAYNAAAEWAVGRMGEWGLKEVKLEKWGPFGRGWSNHEFMAYMREPQPSPLIGFARPWSPGTSGLVSGEPMLAIMSTEADFEKYKGKLKGKIVLVDQPRLLTPVTQPLSRRLTDAELAEAAKAPEPAAGAPYALPQLLSPDGPRDGWRVAQSFRNKQNKFLTDEGVLVALYTGDRADGGTVRSSAAGSRDPKDPLPPPAVALTPEHYNRIARLLNKNVKVTLEFNIVNKFYEETTDTFNVLGEIPGATKPDEVVMLGGHLDSWTGGTGAADDAAGCAVMLEAARILQTLDLKMARTVRVALWAAEEQGLLGSRAYVKEHFADRDTMQLKPEHAKLSGYFNVDNGTGRLRGVYLQGNDMMRPIFEAWLQPFHDLGATTITIQNTAGTDHLSFDAVGLPGFQFIQDPLEYGSRTHHTNMDVFDRLQQGDLMQASAIVASVAYHAATRPELLPRKPLPKPPPK